MSDKKPSIEELKAKAEGGDVEAVIEMGVELCIGERIEQNLDEAVKFFELAKQKGSLIADVYLFDAKSLRHYKDRVPLTYLRNLQNFKELCGMRTISLYQGIELYHRYRHKEALDIFYKEYEEGNKEAAYWIACVLERIAKTEDDYDQVVKYYLEHFGNENTEHKLSMRNIRDLVLDGKIKESKQTFELLCKLYEECENDKQIRVLLAHYYYEGIGTNVDKDKAFALYKIDSMEMIHFPSRVYHYEYGRLLVESSCSESPDYDDGVYHLVKAMSRYYREAGEYVEKLLKVHDPIALKHVISLYHKSGEYYNPYEAIKHIREYFVHCSYDIGEMPEMMYILAEFYFKGRCVVQSFSLSYFWATLSFSLAHYFSKDEPNVVDDLMKMLDPKEICTLQKIVKDAHIYISNLPEGKPMGDLEERFMSSFAEVEDYDRLINSNINLSIELAELKNDKDGSLDKAVSFHSYFSNSKFDVEKVSLLLCVKDPTLGNRNEREDMAHIDRADLDGFYVFYEDLKDYKNFRVFNQRIGTKIRNYLLKLAYYSNSGGEQIADLLPYKIDDTISRLNTMFSELFKPYLDKARTPFIDLDGFRIQVTLDHPEYIDTAQ